MIKVSKSANMLKADNIVDLMNLEINKSEIISRELEECQMDDNEIDESIQDIWQM